MKPPSNLPQPPRQLGEAGRDLWDSIQSEYLIEDSAGIAVLMQACAALDRAESLAAQIAADGVTVAGSSGPRVHPCVKDENQSRALVVRCLARLGVLSEEIKPVGRGPGRRPKGWEGFDRAD